MGAWPARSRLSRRSGRPRGRHLARLVYLHDGLAELHAVVDSPVWDRQWQQHFQRISTLLDTHTTATERSAARTRITDSDRTTIDRLLRRMLDA